MYYKGQGVEKNDDLAKEWLTKADKKGIVSAKEKMKQYFEISI